MNDNKQQNCENADGESRQVEQIVSGRLTNGRYITNNGSILEISGYYGGTAKVQFDWLEENACIDCKCEPYPEEFAKNDWRMVWHCDVCGGGNAKLHKDH